MPDITRTVVLMAHKEEALEECVKALYVIHGILDRLIPAGHPGAETTLDMHREATLALEVLNAYSRMVGAPGLDLTHGQDRP